MASLRIGSLVHVARAVALMAAVFCAVRLGAAESTTGWWSAPAAESLQAAGTNRAQIVRALESAPITQRPGLQFLIENMPEPDLQTLTADYLLENLTLSYDALAQAAWRETIPQEIFFNDILPYASVNERRDNWRRLLRDKCAPLVTDCRTPTEAAMRLNQRLFKLVNVRYSTERKHADQGPLETMESGLATCTGLSILLVDACRSIGVPARVVATPLWANLRGNHTWVEIWDGDWHFAGAAEPDPKGLDRGWFVGDAAQARTDEPRHAIYASSYKKTGLSFPLVWARKVTYVAALNVTERYAKPPAATNQCRLLVRVVERPNGRRVAAKVLVNEITGTNDSLAASAGTNRIRLEGTSRDESADLNDLLPFELKPARTYEVRAEYENRTAWQSFRPGNKPEELITIVINPTPSSAVEEGGRAPASALPPRTADRLRQLCTDYFKASTNEQRLWKFPSSLDRLLQTDEEAVRGVVWQAFREAPLHSAMRQDYEQRQVRFEKHLSTYTLRAVGTCPSNGWPLFIAMHGGGNAPKAVNDSQWRVMQRYYRDHAEVGGYLYLALRAPNDTWNGFYDVYVYPLIENLVRQMVLFAGVNPDKVFLMGYSHGGYGAYAIGPKIPDRFAAIHASAAAATDGESTPRTLRNTVFTVMVGEKDTMYGRYERNQKFRGLIDALRQEHPQDYPVSVRIVEGNGHTGLPDRDKIADMFPVARHSVPRDLTWLMTDKVVQNFFWLHVPTPDKGRSVEASCHDNSVAIQTSTNVASVMVMLDSRLVDLSKPVTFRVNGRESRKRVRPSLRVLCASLQRRGDPQLAFTVEESWEMR
jgi:pimeloyl-ACP methyl ester carboxylesterase